MKIKIILVSILLLLFVVFTGGCLQFMEELGGITSPSLEVDRSGDGVVNYWAVIVGIEDYQSMTDLSYTIDDAEDMEDMLVSYSNWNIENIQLLTDNGASKTGIDEAIENMALKADADDVFLFFFSGHGSNIPDEEGGDEVDRYDEVICPWDTTAEIGNVISDDELGDWLAECKGNVAVILDTCMSGGFTKGIEEIVKSVPNPQVPKDAIAKKHFGEGLVEHLKQRPISRDLNQVGYVVLMACEEDKSAYESRRLKNGVFTYYIVEGLWGPADEINISDDKISAEEAFYYADPLVRQYKPTNQDPQIWDGYAGDLMLVIASPSDAGTIAGNVTEAEEDSAIAGATVVVEGTSLSATTDDYGDYNITDVAEGTYTVTASADGYENASQDVTVITDTTTLNVDFTLNPLPATGTMHVHNIDMSSNEVTAGPNTFYTAVATVTVFDSDGNPVEGATVYGQWSGVTTDVDSGVTDANGQVSLESDKVKNPTSGTIFTFTVDDVIKAGWTYDSEGSVTSESITAP